MSSTRTVTSSSDNSGWASCSSAERSGCDRFGDLAPARAARRARSSCRRPAPRSAASEQTCAQGLDRPSETGCSASLRGATRFGSCGDASQLAHRSDGATRVPVGIGLVEPCERARHLLGRRIELTQRNEHRDDLSPTRRCLSRLTEGVEAGDRGFETRPRILVVSRLRLRLRELVAGRRPKHVLSGKGRVEDRDRALEVGQCVVVMSQLPPRKSAGGECLGGARSERPRRVARQGRPRAPQARVPRRGDRGGRRGRQRRVGPRADACTSGCRNPGPRSRSARGRSAGHRRSPHELEPATTVLRAPWRMGRRGRHRPAPRERGRASAPPARGLQRSRRCCRRGPLRPRMRSRGPYRAAPRSTPAPNRRRTHPSLLVGSEPTPERRAAPPVAVGSLPSRPESPTRPGSSRPHRSDPMRTLSGQQPSRPRCARPRPPPRGPPEEDPRPRGRPRRRSALVRRAPSPRRASSRVHRSVAPARTPTRRPGVVARSGSACAGRESARTARGERRWPRKRRRTVRPSVRGTRPSRSAAARPWRSWCRPRPR